MHSAREPTHAKTGHRYRGNGVGEQESRFAVEHHVRFLLTAARTEPAIVAPGKAWALTMMAFSPRGHLPRPAYTFVANLGPLPR